MPLDSDNDNAWSLRCVRGVATRCQRCESRHYSCEEVSALRMGNVRAALRSIAGVVDLSLGPDEETSWALLLIAGEFMHRLVVLVRGHKRAYGLTTGPNATLRDPVPVCRG
ncbi:hypothetical protein SPBR_08939 [Sporothrix brasiliensis 5110]|uniref:Uncharacterized protein n=1 Tax=Sporothrix brasiliensis 5110 TaxID=1398154 RepID=A0A0C2EMT7_9PEZI|nr:uncharacterized protein SPBR_08939 [Sporothrix brasiliensis 5110]KIH87429.1 hypothetical protein SPBR_08939 [Sporothrix brasiliensis 5110]